MKKNNYACWPIYKCKNNSMLSMHCAGHENYRAEHIQVQTDPKQNSIRFRLILVRFLEYKKRETSM